MFLFLFMGIFLVSFATYQLISYKLMFPSGLMGKKILRTARFRRWEHAFLIVLADKIRKKYDLQFRDKRLGAALRYMNDDTEITVYVISRILTAIAGVMIAIPILFIDLQIFSVICVLSVAIALQDTLMVLSFYRRYILELEGDMEFILQIACKVTPIAEEWEPFFKIAEKAATILWKQEFQRIRRSNEDILSAIGYYWKDWDSDVLCRFRDGILQGKSEEYYKTALKELRTEKKKEREKRIKRKINEQRLLPWVFFLLQIVLGIMVLT